MSFRTEAAILPRLKNFTLDVGNFLKATQTNNITIYTIGLQKMQGN